MFVSCFNFFYSYFVYLHFFSIFFFKKILVFLICFIIKKNLKKLYFCLIRCKFEVWKKKSDLFFFFKYGFFSLSFALCFVSYFLSSIF